MSRSGSDSNSANFAERLVCPSPPSVGQAVKYHTPEGLITDATVIEVLSDGLVVLGRTVVYFNAHTRPAPVDMPAEYCEPKGY